MQSSFAKLSYYAIQITESWNRCSYLRDEKSPHLKLQLQQFNLYFWGEEMFAAK